MRGRGSRARGRQSAGRSQRGRKRSTQVAESTEEESEFIPSTSSEEEETLSEDSKPPVTSPKRTPKKPKTQTPKTPKRKQATPLKQQLSARKRDTSRISPVSDSDGGPSSKPSVKKQRKASASSKSPINPLTPSALDAIKKVDQELKKLPPESKLEFSMLEGSGFQAKLKSDAIVGIQDLPDDVPKGHPDCFSGKTFVISGNIGTLAREQVQDLIRSHGGRVTTSISGKTSILVVGTDCGKSKMSQAREKKVKIIDRTGLYRLIEAGKVEKDSIQLPAGPSTSQEQDLMQIEDPGEDDHTPSGDLWVDKYKPSNLDDLIGNNSVIQHLYSWLSQWRSIHLRNAQPEDPTGKIKASDFAKKAVLLSGSPGVGKTTAALLISRELNFDPIEVNASDTRNKADKLVKTGVSGKLSNQIQVLCQNNPFSATSSSAKPLVLIMDEVDGMSSGDRGGISDLIENIKRTKVPIICICNDKYNRKLTSLKNHCLELTFRKPTKQQIQKRLLQICEEEGFQFSNSAVLEKLIDQSKGDIRLLLGGLQFIRAQQKLVTFDDITSKQIGITKDQDISPFEACGSLFAPTSVNLTWTDRTNMVFEDVDLIPLFIQENYLNYLPKSSKTAQERLRTMAKAADFFSFSERINQCIRGEQKWSLMPSYVQMGCLATTSIMTGQRVALNPGEMNLTRFTSFLGNLSSGNKQRRLMKEMIIRMSSGSLTSVDKDAAALDFFPVLRSLLTEPLKDSANEGISEVLDLMKHNYFTKDCYDYIIDVTNFKNLKNEDSMKSIPSKVKSTLTRQVNSANITCPAIAEDPTTGKAAVSESDQTPAEGTAATNPESGIIIEAIKTEDQEQEKEEQELTVDEFNKSGYSITERSSTKPTITGKRPSKSKSQKNAPSRNVKKSRKS